MDRDALDAVPARGPESAQTERRRLAGALPIAYLLAGLILVPLPTPAEVWKVARGPSSLEFAVGHLLFSEVTGRFRHFSGSVECPGEDFTGAKVEARIEVASISTGHADRDRQLLTEEFFGAERFPELRFKSRSVTRTGTRTYRLVGDLAIRGRTREVELVAVYRGERRTAQGVRRDFSASGTINRSDFGLGWNHRWAGRALVAEKVKITLAIALFKTADSPVPDNPVPGMRFGALGSSELENQH